MHEKWRRNVAKGTASVDMKGRRMRAGKWWNGQMLLTDTVACDPWTSKQE